MSTRRTDVVSASEIASWAWCPESWRLEALGEEPENKTELAADETAHARTAAFEVWTRRAVSLGRCVMVLGFVTAALGFALFGGAGR